MAELDIASNPSKPLLCLAAPGKPVSLVCRPHPVSSDKVIKHFPHGYYISAMMREVDLGSAMPTFCDRRRTHHQVSGALSFTTTAVEFSTDGILLTLGHLDSIVGECRNVRLASPGEIPDAEGECLIGEAVLYDSTLALKAWEGIQRGSSNMCVACWCVLRTPHRGPGALPRYA